MKTPCYTIHLKQFEANCFDVMNSFKSKWSDKIAFGYSVKTNHEASLIKYAHEKLGWLVEVVSPDEYRLAKKIGCTGDDIIFNGPCKADMLHTALDDGVAYINFDNLDEVKEFCNSSSENKFNVKVGLRVNFDIAKECPDEINEDISRFGLSVENGDFGRAVELLRNSGVNTIGLHMHRSSKTRSLKVFNTLATMVVKLIKKYEIIPSFIDIGGGFFGGQRVVGKPTMMEYATTITDKLKEAVNPEDTLLILEPGASVIATAITYETKILSIRDIRGVKIATLDGTLLHINPFMRLRNQPYSTEYIENYETRTQESLQLICGCTCMENDRLVRAENKQELRPGDILSFKNVGAYTMAFNSEFIVCPPSIRIEQ